MSTGQWAILLGLDGDDHYIEFTHEPVDYLEEGQCWLECRLRSNREDDELLVAIGWTLCRGKEDGSWLIDGVDWQDFRDRHRPGIGREEWERICG
mmetsp:Transcript_21782/g.33819  ORF Transcript_21782/g.33819 Transcript_21782/m.33819 type:complete len:95 (-) Transcript_21782:31-315(-)